VRFPAVFMRGGTSRALFFRRDDLPDDRALWDRIFQAALGGPDPYGRQLDGLGGGYSSTSKVAVIGPPSRPDVDVDYTFAQVDVTTQRVDYRGNCGNISSAVGPYAIDEGLVSLNPQPSTLSPGAPERAVRFFNTNTKKVIVAHVPIADRGAAVDGDFELPGVPGRGARIALDFLDPGGAVTGKLLPTGSPRDELEGVAASLVDATNPMVFVRAADLGLNGAEPPDALDADAALLARLERIRAAATVRMGMAPDLPTATERSPAVPKIALVAPGGGGASDLTVRLVSMGKFHRAVALTGAMCLAVAAHLPGTLVAEAAGRLSPGAEVRIGHPAGVLPIAANVEDGQAKSVRVYRTARRLMEGWVRVPGRVLTDPDPFADRLATRRLVVAD
jgi:hypothetical protein